MKNIQRKINIPKENHNFNSNLFFVEYAQSEKIPQTTKMTRSFQKISKITKNCHNFQN